MKIKINLFYTFIGIFIIGCGSLTYHFDINNNSISTCSGFPIGRFIIYEILEPERRDTLIINDKYLKFVGGVGLQSNCNNSKVYLYSHNPCHYWFYYDKSNKLIKTDSIPFEFKPRTKYIINDLSGLDRGPVTILLYTDDFGKIISVRGSSDCK